MMSLVNHREIGKTVSELLVMLSKVDSQSSQGSMAQLWLSAGCRIERMSKNAGLLGKY